MRYHFYIVYEKPAGRYVSLPRHEEYGEFKNGDVAHNHFRALLDKFKVNGGTYYLCHWAEAETRTIQNVMAI